MKIRSVIPRQLSGATRVGALLAGVVLAVELAAPSAVHASGVTVTIDWAFYPSPVTVYAGQSVTWVNHGTVDHWVTPFLSGFVGSGPIPPGGSFTVVFRTVGSITYFDRQYTFMKGTVNVVAATPRPTSTPRPTARPTATPRPTPKPTATPVARVTPRPTAKPTPKPTKTPVPAVAPASSPSGGSSGSASPPGSSPVVAGAGSTTSGPGGGSPLDGLLPILAALVLVVVAFLGGLAYQGRRSRRAANGDPGAADAPPPPVGYRYAPPDESPAEAPPPPPVGYEVHPERGTRSGTAEDLRPRWLRRDAQTRGLRRDPRDIPPDDDW